MRHYGVDNPVCVSQAPHQAPGQPFKFTIPESLDRIKEEFQFLQAQYHRWITQTHSHDGKLFCLYMGCVMANFLILIHPLTVNLTLTTVVPLP